MNSFAQSSPAPEFAHRLLFNIWHLTPDSQVLAFVKKYSPNLTGGKKEYTSYPATIQPGTRSETVHSLFFKQHLGFPGHYLKGRLDLELLETGERPDGIRDIAVHFFYDSKLLADTDLDSITKELDRTGWVKRVERLKYSEVITYAPKIETGSDQDIRLIMTENPLQAGRFDLGIDIIGKGDPDADSYIMLSSSTR